MSRLGHYTAGSILIFATLSLTACGMNEANHESQEQTLEPTFTEVETAEPSLIEDPTPHSFESQDKTAPVEPSHSESKASVYQHPISALPEFEFTGDYREDLKTVG